MKYTPESAVILIPSLEPDDRLPAYVRKLRERGFTRAVIVNDGSSEKYQPIFDELAAMEGVTVLKHEVNRGKGCGLKTGYTYIRDHMPDASGVITADADGQHLIVAHTRKHDVPIRLKALVIEMRMRVKQAVKRRELRQRLCDILPHISRSRSRLPCRNRRSAR